MARYDTSKWTDYVRGLLDADETEEMRSYLESADPRERGLVASLERLVAAAETESRHQPPDYAVRSVKAFFELQKPQKKERRSIVPLELSFDSLLAPAPAGARSLHDTTRQLLYQSEDYALDVRIDYPSGAREAVIVGQLLRRLGEPVTHVPAYLIAAGEIAASSFTGEFGSFYMEGERNKPMELRLHIDSEREISVILDREVEA